MYIYVYTYYNMIHQKKKGHVRFEDAKGARLCLTHMRDRKQRLGGCELEMSLLQGEDEAQYWRTVRQVPNVFLMCSYCVPLECWRTVRHVTSIYICICIYIHIDVHVCVCACVCVCKYICIYKYMRIVAIKVPGESREVLARLG
jgi:hypothetical protein